MEHHKQHFCVLYQTSFFIAGKDFAPPDDQCQIYVVASLESKEVNVIFDMLLMNSI